MTNFGETFNPGIYYPREYTVPADQMATEAEAIDGFAHHFPHEVALLDTTLFGIKQIANGKAGMATAVLQLPESTTDTPHDPYGVFDGDMSVASRFMLDHVYTILGASIIDEVTYPENPGVLNTATRIGEYQGETVYAEETQSDASAWGKQTLFKVRFLSERMAELDQRGELKPEAPRARALKGLLHIVNR